MADVMDTTSGENTRAGSDSRLRLRLLPPQRMQGMTV
jgi:hypothetical protein